MSRSSTPGKDLSNNPTVSKHDRRTTAADGLKGVQLRKSRTVSISRRASGSRCSGSSSARGLPTRSAPARNAPAICTSSFSGCHRSSESRNATHSRLRCPDAGVASRRKAPVLLVDDPDAPCKWLQAKERIVRRSVVHDNHFNWPVGLAESALYGSADELPIVVGRDDDGHQRPARVRLCRHVFSGLHVAHDLTGRLARARLGTSVGARSLRDRGGYQWDTPTEPIARSRAGMSTPMSRPPGEACL